MTYPALELLLQGYLHIDWPDDYDDVWQAVESFVAGEPLGSELASEVTSLLDGTSSEAETRAMLLGELHSGYLPEADGYTVRNWLSEVRARVAMS